MAVDSSLVDRIVQGVLQQMQSPAKPAAPVATAPSPEAPGLRLAQAIITAEVIEAQVPKGTSQLVVTPKAILTPAALDVVRARKLKILREAAGKSVVGTPTRRLAVVVKSSPVLDRLLTDRSLGWTRELLGCPDDAAKLAIGAICRGDADAVAIFATQHYRAACFANRHERVKAVAVATVDELQKAAAQMRVNVVSIDPTSRSDFEIRRILDAVAKLPRGES
jgi:hypothetical protein